MTYLPLTLSEIAEEKMIKLMTINLQHWSKRRQMGRKQFIFTYTYGVLLWEA